jgi:hypothetical protein
MSFHQTQAINNEQLFKHAYSACNPHSTYHDLKCKHRVQTAYTSDPCGTNCINCTGRPPFICPDCVVLDVRVEMLLEGLNTFGPNDNLDIEMSNNGLSREEQILAIANSEINKLLQQGHRVCKIMPKFEDSKMQFFNQFLVEEGFEGINEEARDTMTPGMKLKRPLHGARYKRTAPKKTDSVWEPRVVIDLTGDEEQIDMEVRIEDIEKDWADFQKKYNPVMSGAKAGDGTVCSLAELMGDTRVGLVMEDDATKAVREALGACALGTPLGGL